MRLPSPASAWGREHHAVASFWYHLARGEFGGSESALERVETRSEFFGLRADDEDEDTQGTSMMSEIKVGSPVSNDGIGWPLVGRFKMEGGAFGNHIVPIAGVTKSGLQPLKWGDRLIGALQDEGVTKGWAFCREDGRQAHCADYGETVFSKLEEIQNNRPDLIEQDCKVREEYGLQRSWRRGFASEAANQGVKETDINAQCRWQSEMKTGRMVFRSMADRYTDYRLNRSRLLKPSRAL